MAKKNIHPETHSLTISLSDGRGISIVSTWGNSGDIMKLDVDPTNHPAWRKDSGTFVNANNDQISKFKKKYGTMFN